MPSYRINGNELKAMLVNGLNNIRAHEAEVNAINVFPVPDGDTGSNLRLTLENAIKNAPDCEHAGKYLQCLAHSMLYGARGNSGVILSQLFKGMAEELEDKSVLDASEFADGFKKGYKKAYEAVETPKEGTILTVARQGINNVIKLVSRFTPINVFFSLYIAEMKSTLKFTPELLPALKEAGVVDSGGQGYIYIIEGMYKYLLDEIVVYKENDSAFDNPQVINSDDDYGYAIEFVIQEKEGFSKKDLTNDLVGKGSSLVCVEENSHCKVIIHSNDIKPVISVAKMYGTIETINIENMGAQNKDFNKPKKIIKELGIISIANSDSLKQIYQNLGCDIVIDALDTMNTSTQEIVDAINSFEAKTYAIVINNKNIHMAAMEAKKLLEDKNIEIIESEDFMQGYYALACDEPTSNNINYRIKSMNEGLELVISILGFRASRDCKLNGKEVKKDHFTSLCKDKVLSSSINCVDCILDALSSIDDIDEKSSLIIMKGSNFDMDEDVLSGEINDKFDNLSISYLESGQRTYDFILGVI